MSTLALAAWGELLRRQLAGVAEPSDQQLAALYAHYQQLVRWNRVLNLTSIRSAEEAIRRHYAESLFLAAHLPPGPLRIADIGSGAGFPGFPVAVLRPDCSVTLIESHLRKAVFLKDVSRPLPNVQVAATRAEQVEPDFDHVISRAVSYQDLRYVLQNLAPHAGLLTGAEDPPVSLGFAWQEPIPLPFTKQTFLRIGHRC